MAEPTTPTDAAALRLVAAAAINAFIGVAAGAFGAHGLRARLEPRMLEIFEVGVRYQMYHALAMLAAAWLSARGVALAQTGGWVLQVGIVIFSGSLYALALTGVTKLGAITPLGGLAFLVGWGMIAFGALRGR
jgi:uncharacterized membrane protein YgdD (TMEM256/DUF423 family)